MKTTLSLFTFFYPFRFWQFQQEEIHFESANPFSLSDVILHLDELETQSVYGQLTYLLIALTPKKISSVIGVAGSLGWRQHHKDYMKMYQDMGLATFELNSFKARRITSTVVTDQVTIAGIILDAYRALEKLAKHPNINPEKVSITGWSLGGGVSLFSAWLPLKNAITTKYAFASHLAFYPPCFIKPENLEFSKAPIHILIGEADNWTPASPCKNLVNTLAGKANIDITIYPEAHHGFDSEAPLVRNENAYSFKDCLFDLTAEGDILMNYLKLPMDSPLMQKIGFLFCVQRGVNIGGSSSARAQSMPFLPPLWNKL